MSLNNDDKKSTIFDIVEITNNINELKKLYANFTKKLQNINNIIHNYYNLN